jgi:hypothetical protein
VKEWDRTKRLTTYVDTEYNQSFPVNRSSNNVVEFLCMGMEVALFDWLRMLDQKMEYDIRHGDRTSTEFKALTGLLTGDPASPVRWNFFMAELIMLEDDSILSGIRITVLAQSRRYTSNPLSAAGLQRRLNTLSTRCSLNFIVVNMIKTTDRIFWSGTCEPRVQTWRNHADCYDPRKICRN